jgi:c-di-GMP phosphodiesterase
MTSSRQPLCSSPLLYEPIFVARQPVFDQKDRIWAYELLFRHSAHATTAQITDQEMATSKVIVDGFAIASSGVDRNIRMLINFPPSLLLKGAALALPKEGCIIEILETIEPTSLTLKACRKYKELGYRLAIDDFVGQPGFEPLLEMADLVKVDVAALETASLIKLVQQLERYKCDLLAEKIENTQMHDLTRSLGFRYFQGYYFRRPELVSGRKISMEQVSKVRLLRELAREDYEFRDLAEIISTDVSLSYRLLMYINSAAFALRQKVSSVAQAIAIMGSDPLRHWLAAVILSDFGSNSRAAELVFTSIRRGRFLELQAARLDCSPYRGGTLFLLGLFSKLDALLGLEMDEILKHMPLDDELNAALCGKKNRPYCWLALAKAIDNGDWPLLGRLLPALGLPADEVASGHQEATLWARNLLKFSKQ